MAIAGHAFRVISIKPSPNQISSVLRQRTYECLPTFLVLNGLKRPHRQISFRAFEVALLVAFTRVLVLLVKLFVSNSALGNAQQRPKR